MDYKALYRRIIENRIKNPLENGTYGEKHHIKPRCLGGGNHKGNLVKLTAREHFLCHYCLVEMFPVDSVERKKMLHAFMIMKAGSIKGNRYFNSRLYAVRKEEYSKQQSVKMANGKSPQCGTCWITNTEERKTIKINRKDLDSYILLGWVTGRRMNFDIDSKDTKIKTKEDIKRKEEKQAQRKKTKNIEVEKEKNYYIKLYHLYTKYGYKWILENTDYKFSNQNLFRNFKKYIVDYKSKAIKVIDL